MTNPALKSEALSLVPCISDDIVADWQEDMTDEASKTGGIQLKIDFATLVVELRHTRERLEEKLDDMCERLDSQSTAFNNHAREDDQRLHALELELQTVRGELLHLRDLAERPEDDQRFHTLELELQGVRRELRELAQRPHVNPTPKRRSLKEQTPLVAAISAVAVAVASAIASRYMPPAPAQPPPAITAPSSSTP